MYVYGVYSRAQRHCKKLKESVLKESVKALIGDGMRGIGIPMSMADTAHHYTRDALRPLYQRRSETTDALTRS